MNKENIKANFFLTCHKDQTKKPQTNMLLFKTYLFITHGKYKRTGQK